MRKLLVVIATLVAFVASPAYARHHHASVRHVRHARIVQAAPEQSFDFFKMPLFSDVANYSTAPREQVVYRHSRRIIMSVNPHETTSELPMASSSEARPSDCYGIAWCGCFMRHHFGIADRSLNLARNWAGVGSPTSAHSGAIVVWRGHVGIMQSEPDEHGRAMVLSGNNGSGNHASVRPAYIRNAIAFRQL